MAKERRIDRTQARKDRGPTETRNRFKSACLKAQDRSRTAPTSEKARDMGHSTARPWLADLPSVQQEGRAL
eukprot:6647390-Alexandrium_andersonii.AAC.1